MKGILLAGAAGTLTLKGTTGAVGKILINPLGGDIEIGSSTNTTTDQQVTAETGKANGVAYFTVKNDVQEYGLRESGREHCDR